jgi:hypothetical protein
MATFKELLEQKSNEKLFFVSDSELSAIEEISTQLEDGTKVYDPILLFQKASILGYWCEADYNDETGGYFFEKVK